MSAHITVIYAYRNRDVNRIALSLKSLQQQNSKSFEVMFVDYGSQPNYSKSVKAIIEQFSFASYHYVAHEGLLWNKSKALNYGIKQAETPYILTADVDVVFAPNFIVTAVKKIETQRFLLFKIGYMSKSESQKQLSTLDFDTIKTTHIGDTFGIGLYSKQALEAVRGLDEFFHFYGSEDEDLNARLQFAGFEMERCTELLLFHLWHPRYPQKKDRQLTIQPRIFNILRINQRHFLENKVNRIAQANSKTWGVCYELNDLKKLEQPDVVIHLENILSHVSHCFREGLKKYSQCVVEINVSEAEYYNTLKYKIKRAVGKETQPYMTMKAVNDLILNDILFKYRNMNYSYSVSFDLKQITFTIDFNTLVDEHI